MDSVLSKMSGKKPPLVKFVDICGQDVGKICTRNVSLSLVLEYLKMRMLIRMNSTLQAISSCDFKQFVAIGCDIVSIPGRRNVILPYDKSWATPI